MFGFLIDCSHHLLVPDDCAGLAAATAHVTWCLRTDQDWLAATAHVTWCLMTAQDWLLLLLTPPGV